MQRDLYRIEPLHAESLSPTDWLIRSQTPKLVQQLADQLGCGTDELFASKGDALYMHAGLLIHYLLTAIPESGAALGQLADHDGRLTREHAEAKLAEFFNDETAAAIVGAVPAVKT